MPSKPPLFVPRHLPARLAKTCAASFALLSLTAWIHGAETNQPSSDAFIPKSVFVSEGATGKDPFFPNSTRLQKKAPEDTGKSQPIKEDFSRLLKLTGITGGAKPGATINNLTFAVGEEQEVKFEGRKIRIRVLEIRAKSVLLNVDRQSEPLELKLRDSELKFIKE